MKRKIIAAVIIIAVLVVCLTACLNSESQRETEITNSLLKPASRAIKTVYFSIESQHAFKIRTASVLMGVYSPEDAVSDNAQFSIYYNIMSTEDITDNSAKNVHTMVSNLDYKVRLNCDLGRVLIQFQFLIDYASGLPMSISKTCDCYVKTNGYSINFFEDSYCTIPFSVDYNIDTNYSTGEHLTDCVVVHFYMTS